MNPARRARSGRQSTKSSPSESAAVRIIAREHCRHERDPQRAVEGVRGERAEGHEVAVGEVDQAQDPVDDRDSDRGDRDHGAGHEAVREQLPEHAARDSDELGLGHGAILGEAGRVEHAERLVYAGRRESRRRGCARPPARS